MNAVAPIDQNAVMERVLLAGDLSKLSTQDRLFYYGKVCDSVGLNPLTRPFDYLTLNGKMVLYAKRDATDQLRKIHNVSVTIKLRETIEGVYVVTANAKDKTGREDESTGAVSIQGLKGDALANALMKAETKAKRRVTLSICGLGLLDETEIETIPSARISPQGDAAQHADPIATENAVKKMREALTVKVDGQVYSLHVALNADQDVYIAASERLTSAERTAWKAAIARHGEAMKAFERGEEPF